MDTTPRVSARVPFEMVFCLRTSADSTGSIGSHVSDVDLVDAPLLQRFATLAHVAWT
jgi:hypothetical protein